jgi:hypothetical protein
LTPSIFLFAFLQFGGRNSGELNFSVEGVERDLRLPVSEATDDTPVNLTLQMLFYRLFELQLEIVFDCAAIG